MLTITLPPEVAARLTAEATRLGTPPERLAVVLLNSQLPPRFDEPVDPAEAARQAAAVAALFESWRNAPPSPEDDDDDMEEFAQNMNANRAGERPLFPPELKGVSWGLSQ